METINIIDSEMNESNSQLCTNSAPVYINLSASNTQMTAVGWNTANPHCDVSLVWTGFVIWIYEQWVTRGLEVTPSSENLTDYKEKGCSCISYNK